MRISIVLSAVVLAACSLQSQKSSTASEEQEILQAENRLADALNTLDDATLDVLWDDRLVFVGSNGHATTKAQRLKSIRDARTGPAPRVTSTNDDVRIQIVSGTTAVAYVVSSWHGADITASQQYRATHVWARENGVWKLLTAHVSKVAP